MHLNLYSTFLWIFCLSLSGLQRGYAVMTPIDFVVVWNVPIHKCTHLNISFDLWKYNIVYNENGTFVGENMTIFYKIGQFPHFTKLGTPINGGIPQLGQFSDHRTQVAQDVTKTIPNPSFQGFAVLDWEEWRPNWYTSWGVFNIYREESRKLIRHEEPLLMYAEIEEKAQYEYEFSARVYMQSTLMISRFLRPKGLWGYYGFPDCYNYEPLQKYCSNEIQKINDGLSWLYSSSSALYPSIYIGLNGFSIEENSVYVYGKLNEAKRIGEMLPIYPYSSIHYRDSEEFMSVEDLLITVGQAAALRFPGVVIWGGYTNFNSEEKCRTFSNYVHSIFGPTVNKIRESLESTTYELQFDDSLNEELWAQKIFEYYEYDKY